MHGELSGDTLDKGKDVGRVTSSGQPLQELSSSGFPWSREWPSCCLEGHMDRAVPLSKPSGHSILNPQDADMFVLAFKQYVGFNRSY